MATVTINNIYAVNEAGNVQTAIEELDDDISTIKADASTLGSGSSSNGSILVADGSGQIDWKLPYVL